MLLFERQNRQELVTPPSSRFARPSLEDDNAEPMIIVASKNHFIRGPALPSAGKIRVGRYGTYGSPKTWNESDRVGQAQDLQQFAGLRLETPIFTERW